MAKKKNDAQKNAPAMVDEALVACYRIACITATNHVATVIESHAEHFYNTLESVVRYGDTVRALGVFSVYINRDAIDVIVEIDSIGGFARSAGEIRAEVNWSSIGAVDSSRAHEFAENIRSLAVASDQLKRALTPISRAVAQAERVIADGAGIDPEYRRARPLLPYVDSFYDRVKAINARKNAIATP